MFAVLQIFFTFFYISYSPSKSTVGIVIILRFFENDISLGESGNWRRRNWIIVQLIVEGVVLAFRGLGCPFHCYWLGCLFHCRMLCCPIHCKWLGCPIQYQRRGFPQDSPISYVVGQAPIFMGLQVTTYSNPSL